MSTLTPRAGASVTGTITLNPPAAHSGAFYAKDITVNPDNTITRFPFSGPPTQSPRDRCLSVAGLQVATEIANRIGAVALNRKSPPRVKLRSGWRNDRRRQFIFGALRAKHAGRTGLPIGDKWITAPRAAIGGNGSTKS
jgi:hypothetical protein